MYGKRCSIAVLLAGLFCSTVARAQEDKPTGSRRIEAIDRRVDAYSQSVKPEVKADVGAIENTTNTRAPRSTSSWGPSSRPSSSGRQSSSQSAGDRGMPKQFTDQGVSSQAVDGGLLNQSPALADPAKENTNFPNFGTQPVPLSSTSLNQLGSAALANRSTTPLVTNTTTTRRTGMVGQGRTARFGTLGQGSMTTPGPGPTAAVAAGASSALRGGSPSFATSLEHRPMGTSSTSILTSSQRLRARQEIKSKKARRKHQGAHALLAPGVQNRTAGAQGAKSIGSNGANPPPYGADPTSDHGMFHPGQK